MGSCTAVVVVLLPLLSLVPAAALAGPVSNAAIALHLMSPTGKSVCTRTGTKPICSQIVTRGDLLPSSYFAYVLVTDGSVSEGVAGLQFGVSYAAASEMGVDVYAWTSCADLQFAMDGWPASGTGIVLTWDSTTNCQRYTPSGDSLGVVATVGFFYVTAYSADTLRVTTWPADGMAMVASCTAIPDTLESSTLHPSPPRLGTAVFSQGGTVSGYNPCGAGN